MELPVVSRWSSVTSPERNRIRGARHRAQLERDALLKTSLVAHQHLLAKIFLEHRSLCPGSLTVTFGLNMYRKVIAKP
ncbi:MAG: hypothetical protein EXQ55_03530 [Acidobacteria bacterium]|nr:hypothetical protein [Acidobacteriota bacterium]